MYTRTFHPLIFVQAGFVTRVRSRVCSCENREKSCSIKPRIFPLDPVGLTVLLLSLGWSLIFFFFSFLFFFSLLYVNRSRMDFLICAANKRETLLFLFYFITLWEIDWVSVVNFIDLRFIIKIRRGNWFLVYILFLLRKEKNKSMINYVF